MKSLKNIKVYTLTVVVFAGVLFYACSRRELKDYFTDTALIPVRIDWSLSGVSIEDMHRASIWLFPWNGGLPLEYRLESNLTYREITVPVGVYSVLVFNETIEESDWNGLIFTGTNSYETFAAMSVPQSIRGFYTRSEDLPLIADPEAIAAWSLDRFEVNQEMITTTMAYSKNKSALEAKVSNLTAIKPMPRFERVVVTAYVINLSSFMQATGTIDGMASGVYMVSGERILEPATHAFILNGRVYDANDNDGTTTRTFNIFGRLPVHSARNDLAIDFLLTNGTMHPREEFDATDLIVTNTDNIVRTHIIKLGYGNLNGDHVIELSEADMKTGIVVDRWDEVIVPLN